MERYVALMRGINLLHHKRISMPDLAALFTDVGCREVRTYIQSGNVVFAAPKKVVTALPRTLPEALQRNHGFSAAVVLRSGAEMQAVLAGWPFAEVEENHQHVMFLDGVPTAAAIATLDPNRSPGDEFRVVGREIYLRLPNGVGNSKLNNQFFDSRLKMTSTGRNWRTVRALAEMAQE